MDGLRQTGNHWNDEWLKESCSVAACPVPALGGWARRPAWTTLRPCLLKMGYRTKNKATLWNYVKLINKQKMKIKSTKICQNLFFLIFLILSIWVIFERANDVLHYQFLSLTIALVMERLQLVSAIE